MPVKADLHIISFDVPYPADYGGVIDVYYKLKALKELGLSVILHCFHYGRSEEQHLNDLCTAVYYYPRRTGLMAQLSATPYIISSRNDATLLDRLCEDNAPILFEGLHTTYFLGHPKLSSRKTAVRVHNREDQYYKALYQQSSQFYKKAFYGLESNKLKYFEKRLSKANVLFCLSKQEQAHYGTIHKNSQYLPVFHPYELPSKSVIDHQVDQAIYYGNLSVEENCKAVEFLIEVFKGLPYSLKVAGRGANSDLIKRMSQAQEVEYLGELSNSDLDRLIEESRLCCLPTSQSTGIKLKWIQALFQANEILLNEKMLADTDFKDYSQLANTKTEWREQIQIIFSGKVNQQKFDQRKELAQRNFNNESSAKLLAEWCARAQ